MQSTEVGSLELIIHFNTVTQFPILSNIVLSKTADYSSTKPKLVEHMKLIDILIALLCSISVGSM